MRFRCHHGGTLLQCRRRLQEHLLGACEPPCTLPPRLPARSWSATPLSTPAPRGPRRRPGSRGTIGGVWWLDGGCPARSPVRSLRPACANVLPHTLCSAAAARPSFKCAVKVPQVRCCGVCAAAVCTLRLPMVHSAKLAHHQPTCMQMFTHLKKLNVNADFKKYWEAFWVRSLLQRSLACTHTCAIPPVGPPHPACAAPPAKCRRGARSWAATWAPCSFSSRPASKQHPARAPS